MSEGYTPLHFYKDVDGDWRWHIRAKNGRVIAETSEGYKSRDDAERAAAITLEAMQRATLQAFKTGSDTLHQVMASLVKSLAPTIEKLKEFGLMDENANLTEEGKRIANMDTQEEIEAVWARLDAAKQQQIKEDQNNADAGGTSPARSPEDDVA